MKYATLAAALIGLPAIALAQPQNIYTSFQAGTTWLNNSDNTSTDFNIESDYKVGYALAVRVGTRVTPNWRVEGELSYAENDVSTLTIKNDGGLGQALVGHSLDGTHVDANGWVSSLSGMANVIYDFTPDRRLHPYIGAGIGVARINANNVGFSGYTIVDDSTTDFAYQGIAGASLDVAPAMAVYLDYHFFAVPNPRFHDVSGAGFDGEFKSNTISVGVTYGF